MELKFKCSVIACVLVITGCSSLTVASSLDDWVNQNTGRGETLLCKRDVSGEYFFLTRVGDRIRLGSRLDMTGYTKPYEFIVGWVFQGEDNRSLATKVYPIPIRDEYVKNRDRIFAENVEYRTLNLRETKTMAVTIRIKKCPTLGCNFQVKKSEQEKEYSIQLCEVPLIKK